MCVVVPCAAPKVAQEVEGVDGGREEAWVVACVVALRAASKSTAGQAEVTCEERGSGGSDAFRVTFWSFVRCSGAPT